jgi:hypothetical protein
VYVFRLGIFLSVLLLSFSSIQAQLPELENQRQHIQAEINEVLKLSDNSPDQTQIAFLLSLARNYYLLDDYLKAEKYYLQVIDQDICGPKDYKSLAISLLHNGKAQLAEDFKQAYVAESSASGFEDMWSVERKALSEYARIRETQLTNYKFIYGNMNTDGSTRLNIDNGPVSANIGCNSFINLAAIVLPVENFNNVGSLTDGPDENSYFYAYKNDAGYYGLYYISQKGEKWSKPKQVTPDEEANFTFPYYRDGTLFFSSDRAGGFGQYDIYRASWDGKYLNGIESLGATVNTDKNEILPSVIDGQFSFSSNGFPGQGGYDVYFSNWSFSKVSTLEYPYNSTDNEFLMIDRRTESAAVIKEKEGKSNVYLVEKYWNYDRVVKGSVQDEHGNFIDGAQVLLSKGDESSGRFTRTDLDGKFDLLITDTSVAWRVDILKQHYVNQHINLSLSTLGDNLLAVVLQHEKPVEPEPVFIVNSPSKNVIPAAPSDTLVNDQRDTALTSSDEIFSEVSNEGQYYIVYASAKTYNGAYAFWDEWKETFPDAEILENEELGIYRVGTYAGTTRQEAMRAYRKAKNIKSDAWILRPDQL